MNPKKFRRYELLEILRLDPRASIRELCDRMLVKAPSQVHGLLQELEQEGLIERNRGKARSVYIVEGAAPKKTEPVGRSKEKKRKAAQERFTRIKQSPDRLAKKIEEVVRKAENKAAKFIDGEQWFLREYSQ
jgi:DNA-binding MarR family transcriptional regulator